VNRTKLTLLSALREWDENPRVIDSQRMEQLKRSLEADAGMLEVRPLVALPDGTVIMGNQRLAAARELGWTKIPVATVDLDAQTARSWAIRDNQSYGEWEPADLSQILRELRDEDVDLDVLGFREDELDELLRQRDADPRPPAPPSEDDKRTPAPGSTSRATLTELVLLIPKDRKPTFDAHISALRDAWGTTSTADTVLRAVESAASTP
jgi:ParB-like chromosome segregation protein Spo0J